MSSENIETRERILASAWDLLMESGAAAVRMSDIARRTGISRQAVYLHFRSRAELLIATTRYIDQVKDVDARLAASRAAEQGQERLDAYVEAWGNYIPEIHGVARALIDLQATDDAARAAWTDRMDAVRHGCAAGARHSGDVVFAFEASRLSSHHCLRPFSSDLQILVAFALYYCVPSQCPVLF